MIEQDEQHQHRQTQDDGQRHVRFAHGEDAAEHIVVHVRGHARGAGDDQDADGEGGGAHGGDGRVAVPAGVVRHPQQQKRRQNNYRDGEPQRRHTQGHGDGQCAEGNVAQAVADHGVPFQHQGHAQQSGAQAHQHTGDQRPLHEGEGKHGENIHGSTSRKRRPWGEAR